jgi:hypothetical protein
LGGGVHEVGGVILRVSADPIGIEKIVAGAFVVAGGEGGEGGVAVGDRLGGRARGSSFGLDLRGIVARILKKIARRRGGVDGVVVRGSGRGGRRRGPLCGRPAAQRGEEEEQQRG